MTVTDIVKPPQHYSCNPSLLQGLLSGEWDGGESRGGKAGRHVICAGVLHAVVLHADRQCDEALREADGV